MFTSEELDVIAHAEAIYKSKIKTMSAVTSPDLLKGYCINKLAHQEREVFLLILLDTQHRLIEAVELFKGSIDVSAIYPREVIKCALDHECAAVAFAHNHPSGNIQPSTSDRQITDKLKNILSMIDIRTLDHIVVGTEGAYSFAEHGHI